MILKPSVSFYIKSQNLDQKGNRFVFEMPKKSVTWFRVKWKPRLFIFIEVTHTFKLQSYDYLEIIDIYLSLLFTISSILKFTKGLQTVNSTITKNLNSKQTKLKKWIFDILKMIFISSEVTKYKVHLKVDSFQFFISFDKRVVFSSKFFYHFTGNKFWILLNIKLCNTLDIVTVRNKINKQWMNAISRSQENLAYILGYYFPDFFDSSL